MEKKSLYFIAIIPPEEICDAITAFRLDFKQRFQSERALKVVPHITLKAPFNPVNTSHAGVIEWFQQLNRISQAFAVELHDFGAFKNKNPVVFVHPVMNPSLKLLQQEVIRRFRLSFPACEVMPTELTFKPHITIAYRDLRRDMFSEAWKEYGIKTYKAVFEVASFHLLQHNGKGWDIAATAKLAPPGGATV